MIIINNKEEWSSHQATSKNDGKAVSPCSPVLASAYPWFHLLSHKPLQELSLERVLGLDTYPDAVVADCRGLHSDLVRALPHDRSLL